MSNNNFTYLDDIIDMDEPGNENESNQNREQFSNNYTPQLMNRSIQQFDNNILPPSSSSSTILQNSPYLRKNYNKQEYRPPPQQPPQPSQPIDVIPSYSTPEDYSTPENLFQSNNFVNNYQELCNICKQINNQNNMMFHYIYLIVIITLIIIILMLFKKVLNI